jgi:dephospho-CoA kinase
VFHGKPIIGVAGGIGSGKTFVAKLFGELGCLVIHSDDVVRAVYRDEIVKHTLRHWWGPLIFEPNGDIDRSVVARKIFNSASDKERLERYIHPIVNEKRERLMKSKADDPLILAYIWDTPLLFETDLNKQCDAVVFVDSPRADRLARVKERGWDEAELDRRENSQMPLDSKAKISDYSVANPAQAGDVESVRNQVREVLSRILERTAAPG